MNLSFFQFCPTLSNSDQDRISLYSIDTITRRQVMRIKKKYQLGDYQSSTKFSEITSREVYGAWRIVRRITIEIWE